MSTNRPAPTLEHDGCDFIRCAEFPDSEALVDLCAFFPRMRHAAIQRDYQALRDGGVSPVDAYKAMVDRLWPTDRADK